jgi:hypothetical protein
MTSTLPLRPFLLIGLASIAAVSLSSAALTGRLGFEPAPGRGAVRSPFDGTSSLGEPLVFAVIGDFGTNDANEAATRDLIVDIFEPEFIATVGDNSYGAAGLDVNVGQYYSAYIGAYTGAYGPGSPINRFFPAAGNHDWDDGGGMPAYLAYFTLPGTGIAGLNTSGNERYYDFIQGPVHVFVVSSDAQEPDAISAHDPLLPSEVQARWLRDALAASTSPWKIVLLHHPPFSPRRATGRSRSSSGPSRPGARRPSSPVTTTPTSASCATTTATGTSCRTS